MKQIDVKREIDPKKAELIEALFTNTNRRVIAEKIGISSATLYRWLADPDVQAALAAAERAVLSESARRLLGLQSSSIDVLVELRNNGKPSDSVRLKAAVAILEIGREMRETLQLEQRLEELESLVVSMAARQI